MKTASPYTSLLRRLGVDVFQCLRGFPANSLVSTLERLDEFWGSILRIWTNVPKGDRSI